jgi:hypothetical protein
MNSQRATTHLVTPNALVADVNLEGEGHRSRTDHITTEEQTPCRSRSVDLNVPFAAALSYSRVLA